MAGGEVLPDRAAKIAQAEVKAGIEIEGHDLAAEIIGDALRGCHFKTVEC